MEKEEKYWWVWEFNKEECPEHYEKGDLEDPEELCPNCNGTNEVIQDNVAFCSRCGAYTIGVDLGGWIDDLPCNCHEKHNYDWRSGTVDWMTHEDFYELFPTEESYNKMLQEPYCEGPDCNLDHCTKCA